MCKSFEVVSGRKGRGDRSLLEGLTKMYRDANYSVAVLKIPVDLMEIDTRYQTEVRTARDLRYLTNNWNENKLLPLMAVPHWEEGKVYLVDGYGRWIASQMVDKEKYKELDVLMIFNAPKKDRERLEFEAELYAFQNKDVAKMKAIQRHGAMIILEDEATKKLEKLKEKYGFEYVGSKGNREASVLGSYTETLSLCKVDNGKLADFVFEICQNAGFDRKANGYSTYVFRTLRDIYKLYVEDRKEISEYLSKEFRRITPLILKANAVTKYPLLEARMAVSMYVEDMLVENLGLEQTREVKGTRVLRIAKAG